MNTLNKLFRRTDEPNGWTGKALNESSDWYTWSDDFREFLREWSTYVRKLPSPSLIDFTGLDDYEYTYSLAPSFIRRRDLREQIESAATALYELKTPGRILLFTELLGPHLDRRGLHSLFAVLRSRLAERLGNRRGAMHAPAYAGSNEKEFLLHADLYVAEMLFNVFDDVPKDGTGASVFLSVTQLDHLLVRTPEVPQDVRKFILETLRQPIASDHFDALYDLLHGDNHPWVPSLQVSIAKHQMKFRFARGQGYLIHDRTWLHGREAPSNGVPRFRFHRLAFNTKCLGKKMPPIGRFNARDGKATMGSAERRLAA